MDNLADIHHRHHLIATLRQLRIDNGMLQRDIADDLHVVQEAISRLERADRDPHLATLQRYARALDHRLHMRLTVPGVPGVRPTQFDPGDKAATDNIRARLGAARHHLGLTQGVIAERLGRHHTAVSALEVGGAEPRLGSYQRYARALGGRFRCAIVPAPSVDQVKVDRVQAGKEPFGWLTANEQVALYRRHGQGRSLQHLATQWGVSWDRLRHVAALAEVA